jgi:hypothetical protein
MTFVPIQFLGFHGGEPPTSDGQVGAGQPNRARAPSGKMAKIRQPNKARALDGWSAGLLESRAQTLWSAEDRCDGRRRLQPALLHASTPPRTVCGTRVSVLGRERERPRG